jgi:hypothetical protein
MRRLPRRGPPMPGIVATGILKRTGCTTAISKRIGLGVRLDDRPESGSLDHVRPGNRPFRRPLSAS